MTYAVIAHGIGAAGSQGSVSGLNTSGANLIIIADIGYTGGAAAAISDNKGNTYTPLTEKAVSNVRTRLWYCENPTVGSSHNFSDATSFATIAVIALSGMKAGGSFDVQNGATNASATSLSTGSVTPTEDGEIVIFALGGDMTGTVSSTVGTVLDHLNFQSGVFGATLGYEIQTTATARNPSLSWSGSVEAAAVIATFKTTGAPTIVDVTPVNATAAGLPFVVVSDRSKQIAVRGRQNEYGSAGVQPGLNVDRNVTHTVRYEIQCSHIPVTYAGLVWTNVLNGGNYTGFEDYLDTAGKPTARLINTYGTPGNWISTHANTNTCDGSWHVVYRTYDASSTAAGVKFYLDGNLIASITPAESDNLSATIVAGLQDFQFLNQYGALADFWLDGKISNLIIEVGVERDATFIAANSAPGNPPRVDLDYVRGYWPMMEGSGLTVHDISGAGRHITLTNESMWVVPPALSGVQATGQAGTLTASVSVALAGVHATGQIGVFSPPVEVILSGVAATGQAGTLTASGSVALTGVGATGQAGVCVLPAEVALSGVSATGQIGVLVASASTTQSSSLFFEADLFAHLTGDATVLAAAGSRVYPVVLPQDETLPAVVYQVVTLEEMTNLGGHDGDVEHYRLQVDCWAKTATAARQLADAVRARMRTESDTFRAVLQPSGFDDFEPDTRRFRRMLEFSVWYDVP